jgi:hypothetical protein
MNIGTYVFKEQTHMHGRVAMIAVVGYAIQEFVFKTGVVDETSFFFTPFWS